MARQSVALKACKHPRYAWRVTYRQGEKYEQKYFVAKVDAKGFADEKRVELLNEGRRHGDFTDEERRAVIRSRELGTQFLNVGVLDFTLARALDFYAAHIEACGRSIGTLQAYDEYHAAKIRADIGHRHLKDIEGRLLHFAQAHSSCLISEITCHQIETYLHSLPVGKQTMVGHHSMIRGFLSWCTTRGYAPTNVAAKFDKPKIISPPPGILSAPQTAAIMASAPPDIVPSLAIGFFAGLRTAELERLDWMQIDLQRGFIEVTAAAAKTAQRRLVTIPLNLKAWLLPLARESGPVRPTAQVFRDRMDVAKAASNIIEWPSNACRHSFASYHLALHQDAAATALQLGHMGTEILFKHYRQLARPEDAKLYFEIKPVNS